MKNQYVKQLALLTLIGLFATSCQPSFDSEKNISVYNREWGSGTREAFFGSAGVNFSLAGANNAGADDYIVEGASSQSSNGNMINAVKNDTYGIGYISLSTLGDSGLKGLSFNGIEATEANVVNGTYTLQRPFNYMIRSSWSYDATNGETKQAIINALVSYMYSTEGRTVIAQNGGILTGTSTGSFVKPNICNSNNSAITLKVGGSTSVDKMAQALTANFKGLCGNPTFTHAATGSGDAFKRTQGSSATGTDLIDIGFLSRGVSENAASGTYSGIQTTGGTGSPANVAMCLDAVVVVVSKKNQVNNITPALLKSIYVKDSSVVNITTWKQVTQ